MPAAEETSRKEERGRIFYIHISTRLKNTTPDLHSFFFF